MKNLFKNGSILLGMLSVLFVFALISCDPDVEESFDVRFYTDGGTIVQPLTIDYGSKLEKPEDPTKHGFEFDGWYKDNKWKEAWDFEKDVVTKDFSLYAKWVIKKYSILFDKNDKNASGKMESILIENEDDLYLPENNFELAGHSFAGWATSPDGEVEYEDQAWFRMNGEDLRLYAVWLVQEDLIRFNKNNNLAKGSMNDISVEGKTKYKLPKNKFSLEGYNFLGWATKSAGEVVYSDEDVVDLEGKTINLYAIWAIKSLTITFFANDEEVYTTMDAQSALYGSTIRLNSNEFKHQSKSFAGWATSPLGDIEFADRDLLTIGSENVNLYAVWSTPLPIYFHENSSEATGEMLAQQVAAKGIAILNKNLFQRKGYRFIGWSLSSVGEVDYQDEGVCKIGTEIIELYAQWAINDYKVIFHKNNDNAFGIMESQEITYKESDDLFLNKFSLIGYSFVGWATSSTGSKEYNDGASITMSKDQDVNLYAVWGKHRRITFDKNHENAVGSMSFQYIGSGTSENLIANKFSLDGYMFMGWSASRTGNLVYTDEASYTMGTKDVTLYACWGKKVIFDKNHDDATGEMEDQVIQIGKSSKLQANTFILEQFSVIGWATSPDGEIEYLDKANLTMGSEDVTLYAVWGLLAYTSENVGVMKPVQRGSFQRDSDSNNISVISKNFWMSKHQITRTQFKNLMGSDPSDTSRSSGMSDPVQMVNWYHAIAFCNKLSIKEGFTPVYSVSGVNFNTLSYSSIPTSSNSTWNSAICNWDANGYRLPTEMEWMWAAMGADKDSQPGAMQDGINRTGYNKSFAGYNGSNLIEDYAWYWDNSSSKTHPVGTKLPNELGIYDMSGNVWERCWDWRDDYPSGTVTDSKGSASGSSRVIRGGSWYTYSGSCTVAYRYNYAPSYQSTDYGFRVVRLYE